jgi:hypothetical protein
MLFIPVFSVLALHIVGFVASDDAGNHPRILARASTLTPVSYSYTHHYSPFAVALTLNQGNLSPIMASSL